MAGMAGMGGAGAGLEADALITSRDGIAGYFDPGKAPRPLKEDQAKNLELWSTSVQEKIFSFEIASRIGFSSADKQTIQSAWHLAVDATSGTKPPQARYQPLVSMIRPTKEVFVEQLPYINQYAALRPDRAAEILAQLGAPVAFLGSIVYLQPDRTPWTLKLLDAAYGMTQHVEMRFKHGLACRRPNEFSSQLQPMIPTPGHGTLPSGHATEAFTLASVLWGVLRHADNKVYREATWGDQLMRLAARIAINRTVAGVHFPVDSAAGCVLGLTLGHYFVERCCGADEYRAWKFDGSRFKGDFDWRQLYDVEEAGQKETPFAEGMGTQRLDKDPGSPILEFLWNKAVAEWI
jgi:membrane-associated phospholipid phosphatase